MPSGRILLKSISQSKKLSLLKTDGARLLYTWLIPHLDVNGCFSGDPHVIRGQILTRLGKSLDDIKRYLTDIENNDLIKLYESNGDIFLQVPDFLDKQPNINPEREAKPSIPLPKTNNIPIPDLLKSNSGVTPTQLKLNRSKEPLSPSGDGGQKENGVYLTKKKRVLKGEKLEWFLEFWKVFDYKTGKADAADAWLDIKGLNNNLFQSILKGAKQEASRRLDTVARDKTPKMGQGWLSGKRWEDSYGSTSKGYKFR